MPISPVKVLFSPATANLFCLSLSLKKLPLTYDLDIAKIIHASSAMRVTMIPFGD